MTCDRMNSNHVLRCIIPISNKFVDWVPGGTVKVGGFKFLWIPYRKYFWIHPSNLRPHMTVFPHGPGTYICELHWPCMYFQDLAIKRH